MLLVVLSIDVLGLGDAGAGYLSAAFGAGGAIGIAATATLVGRRRLVPALVAGTLAWSVALAVLGLQEAIAGAFLLLAVAGAGRIVLDVAGRTLLQRTAPTDVLARVFGVVEGLSMAGLAVGSLLASALVALGGARAGLLGVAAVMPLLLLLTGHRLLRADARANVPVVEISLLRSLPIFAPLPAPALEGLAKSLTTVDLPAGEVFIRQGDHGDRFYIVCNGQVAVDIDGEQVAERGRGEGIGEIALLRDVPRTATVRTLAPTRLYALERDPFVAAVTGHDPSARAADRVIAERAHVPDPA